MLRGSFDLVGENAVLNWEASMCENTKKNGD